VAIVGSRAASEEGLEQAGLLARDLARAGVLVVSGMARGIDAAAHWGALEAGGETVAVLAAAPQCAYPADVKPLHDEILRRGSACAEFPLGTALRRGLFVRRNRIVAALSAGVIVVEASPSSGALVTASWARRLGRFLAAVPAGLTRETGWGILDLLRSGARPVGNAGHVLELLETSGAKPSDSDEERLLGVLTSRTASAEELGRALELPIGRAQAALVALEMAGAVNRLPGGRFARSRAGVE
jgi:DNA processing protein